MRMILKQIKRILNKLLRPMRIEIRRIEEKDTTSPPSEDRSWEKMQ